MSKILESLKTLPPKEGMLPQHIADTYFYKKSYRKKHSKNASKKINIITSVFVFAAVLAAILSLLAVTSRVSKHYTNYLKGKIEKAKLVRIFDEGRINSDVVKKFAFRGSAKDKSKIYDKMVFLNNPKKYGWADLAVDFKFPVNFSNRDLSVSLKGKMGGEKVSLILRDADNRSSILTDAYLTSDWRTEFVPAEKAKGAIDISRISQFRLEFSFVGEPPAGNGAYARDMAIYIKDMRIIKK